MVAARVIVVGSDVRASSVGSRTLHHSRRASITPSGGRCRRASGHPGAAVATRLREEHLHDSITPARVLVRARGQVQAPHAIAELSHLSHGILVSALEPPNPLATRLCIMIAQILGVSNLEARLLSLRDQLTEWQKIEIREDVTIDELAASPESITGPAHRLPERRPRRSAIVHDAVIEEESALASEAIHGVEVGCDLRAANVFRHPDARHLVVKRFARQIAIVEHLDLAAILEARPRRCAAAQAPPAASRASRRARSRRSAGPRNHERTPAASDVEQPVAGNEAQLATDEIELRGLRGVDVVHARREIGAGVHHAAIEPEREKVVAQIVVEACGRGVTIPGVQTAVRIARLRAGASVTEPTPLDGSASR